MRGPGHLLRTGGELGKHCRAAAPVAEAADHLRRCGKYRTAPAALIPRCGSTTFLRLSYNAELLRAPCYDSDAGRANLRCQLNCWENPRKSCARFARGWANR